MILLPKPGIAQVYAVSTRATSASSGTDHVVVKALRSGQDETGISVDSATGEIQAYSLIYLGQLTVGASDTISLSVTNNGSPATPLYPDDFAIRVTLNPR